jgi:hypothetical protein
MKKLSLLVLLASLMALVAAAPVFADNHEGDHKDAHGEEHKDGDHHEEKH